MCPAELLDFVLSILLKSFWDYFSGAKKLSFLVHGRFLDCSLLLQGQSQATPIV
jgi:hypothetical protein